MVLKCCIFFYVCHDVMEHQFTVTFEIAQVSYFQKNENLSTF